jgi:hypothetical protein
MSNEQKVRILEAEMVRANVVANHYMRHAAAHIDDKELWELWQQQERHAIACRTKWQAACAEAEGVQP